MTFETQQPFVFSSEETRKKRAPAFSPQASRYTEQERSYFINTNHGNTKQIYPNCGVPQGAIMSPNLWTIFYDTLIDTFLVVDKDEDRRFNKCVEKRAV